MSSLSVILPQDFETIYEIEQKAHIVPWTQSTLRSILEGDYINYQLKNEGVVIGFCLVQKVLDEATILNIAIDPIYQNRGFGKQLLKEMIALLQNMGVNTIFLEVRISNKPAKQLYSSLNFHEIDIRKNYYPAENGREDALIMGLIL